MKNQSLVWLLTVAVVLFLYFPPLYRASPSNRNNLSASNIPGAQNAVSTTATTATATSNIYKKLFVTIPTAKSFSFRDALKRITASTSNDVVQLQSVDQTTKATETHTKTKETTKSKPPPQEKQQEKEQDQEQEQFNGNVNCTAWIQNVFGECVVHPLEKSGFWLGASSLLIWFSAQIPQIALNVRRQDTSALSGPFLALHFFSDVLNVIASVFIYSIGMQLYYCLLYLTMDVVLLLQWFFYKGKTMLKEQKLRRDLNSQSIDTLIHHYSDTSLGGLYHYQSSGVGGGSAASVVGGGMGGMGRGRSLSSALVRNFAANYAYYQSPSPLSASASNMVVDGGSGIGTYNQNRRVKSENESVFSMYSETDSEILTAYDTQDEDNYYHHQNHQNHQNQNLSHHNSHRSRSSSNGAVGGSSMSITVGINSGFGNGGVSQQASSPPSSHKQSAMFFREQSYSNLLSSPVSPKDPHGVTSANGTGSGSKKSHNNSSQSRLYTFLPLSLLLCGALIFVLGSTGSSIGGGIISGGRSHYFGGRAMVINVDKSRESSRHLIRHGTGGRFLLHVAAAQQQQGQQQKHDKKRSDDSDDDNDREEEPGDVSSLWPIQSQLGIAGYVLAWIAACVGILCHIPQILKNWKRKSTAGLSTAMFTMAAIGNFLYCVSIAVHASGSNLILARLPWAVGALGSAITSGIIVTQCWFYYERSEINFD